MASAKLAQRPQQAAASTGQRRQRQLPPLRIGDDRPTECYPLLAICCENTPIAAHGALQLALPGLVEGFDQVESREGHWLPTMRQYLFAGQQFTNESRLFQPPGNRCTALATGGGPAGFADQHRQGRKNRLHFGVDRNKMRHRLLDGHRSVFPVGQEVDGDDIDVLAQHVAMPTPEFPDIGIGHGNTRATPGGRQHVGQRRRRLLAAQQHFVADHQQVDHIGVIARQRQCALELRGIADAVAIDPGAQNHPQPELAGKRRHRIEATVDAVGAHAAADRADQAQIGFDHRRCYGQCRIKRAVAGAPKRGVGDAGQTRLGDLRQGHWPALRKGPG